MKCFGLVIIVNYIVNDINVVDKVFSISINFIGIDYGYNIVGG